MDDRECLDNNVTIRIGGNFAFCPHCKNCNVFSKYNQKIDGVMTIVYECHMCDGQFTAK